MNTSNPFPTETAIDRIRALGDLLVAGGGQSLNSNTLPTIGGLLFELADQLDEETSDPNKIRALVGAK